MRPGPPDDESDESDEAAFGFGIGAGIAVLWPADGASMITSTAGRRPRRSIARRSLRMKGISGAGRARAGGRRAELAVGAAVAGHGACVVGAATGDRARERRFISIGGTVGAVVRSLIREDAPLIEHADMPTVTRAGTDGKGSSSAGGSGETGRRRTVKR